ncbi:hypothetical protein RN001_013837 [Aquatica leii]|uniref:F-box domain-containing protein n=1 Tax=Aquatica leii TaxID=1421715 RepID=A0AAN7PS90_9COLE|nr:hypothetical protein RN001_013837 [Aquatica leii]
MIRSATELLMNDAFASVTVATNPRSRSSQNNVNSKKVGAVIATRFNCMQAWFIRCSWLEKFKFLTRMLYSLSSLSSLSVILNTLLSCSGKSSIYSIANNSNFVYDKGLNDHNRALHTLTLKEAQDNDLQWFRSLKDDSDQVLVFIGLLRLGGGLIMYEVYKKGVQLYEQIVSAFAEVNLKAGTISPPQSSQMREAPCAQNRINIVPDLMYQVNPQDPIVLKTASCKKDYEDAFKKYKAQIENRAGVGPKLDKKDKPSKKNKKGASKSEESSDLDFVSIHIKLQLIPITIVKMIFNYLDPYTLKKIKNVNKYWDYAVKDLLKEKKGRKNLDKFIKKFKKDAPEDVIDESEEHPPKPVTVYDKTYPKKRIKKLFNRCSVLPKLVQNLVEPFVKDSWITTSDDLSGYVLQVQNLKLFPRTFSCNPLLQKQESGATLKRRYTIFDDLVLDDFEDEKEVTENTSSKYSDKTSNITNLF